MNQVELLRHVADNLEAGRPAWHGLLCNGKASAVESVEGIAFGLSCVYSLAPRTRVINGVEVPVPVDKAPAAGSRYWIEAPQFDDCAVSLGWTDDSQDNRFFALGLCYDSKEAAAANCKARYGIG